MARALVICPVPPWPPVGGAEKRTLRLLEAMDSAGVVPHLLTTVAPSAAAAGALRERGWGVDAIPEPVPGPLERARQHLARRPSPYVAGVEARLRELAGTGFAFVQVEHAMAAYYAAHHPARRWVLSMHNVDSEMQRTVARGRRPASPAWLRAHNLAAATATVERRAARAADAVLCVSEADAEHFRRLGARALLVPNGVDEGLFAVAPELPGDERVLFFGRLDYAPNALGLARFLREGWPRLAAARPRASLRVAGAGLGPELARLVEAAPRAQALGLVDDLRAELAASRVAIVPIWHGGGTRLKVLEALAAGRPVVGTPLGVSGVGFENGVHGLLGDTPAELADAAAALLADGDRSARYAAAGRALAERFRWALVTAPAAELYARWAAEG